MSNTINAGDLVVAKVAAQGLVKGRKYAVINVIRTVHGCLLHEVHGVEGDGNRLLTIANASFVLKAA